MIQPLLYCIFPTTHLDLPYTVVILVPRVNVKDLLHEENAGSSWKEDHGQALLDKGSALHPATSREQRRPAREPWMADSDAEAGQQLQVSRPGHGNCRGCMACSTA